MKNDQIAYPYLLDPEIQPLYINYLIFVDILIKAYLKFNKREPWRVSSDPDVLERTIVRENGFQFCFRRIVPQVSNVNLASHIPFLMS